MTAPASGEPYLAIVIPIRNEAASIGRLLDEIEVLGARLPPHEILCIDDASVDDTPRVLATRSERIAGLQVLRLVRHGGQSAAIWAGVEAARAPWIATLDGDGQNDPSDIPALLTVADRPHPSSGPRLVVGRRRPRRDSWPRRAASWIANRSRGVILGDRTPDAGSGIKVFRRDAFLALPYFDHMHRFMPVLVLRAGGEVVSVDVHHRPRLAGRSNYGIADRLRDGLVDLFGVWWLMRRSPRVKAEPP